MSSLYEWFHLFVCRVATIADQLEREEEASAGATVKRLARLEEQVVIWFLVTNVAPVFVIFTLWQTGRVQDSWLTRVGLFNIILRYGNSVILNVSHAIIKGVDDWWQVFVVSSGCPVSQSPAVDYGQPEISGFCSKRNTTAEWATNFFTSSDLIKIFLFKFYKCIFFPPVRFILPCSADQNRFTWHLRQYLRERGQIPCESKAVLLPEQQNHTFPCAGGESAMGGISHIFATHYHCNKKRRWLQICIRWDHLIWDLTEALACSWASN